MRVDVCPDGDAERIREYIREHPGVRLDEYTSDRDPLHGSCYVAAESYFHAKGGTDSGLGIYCLSWKDVAPGSDATHWFLMDGETVIDLSLPRPEMGDDVPWDVARKRAFMTGYTPSKRCQRILDDLDL